MQQQKSYAVWYFAHDALAGGDKNIVLASLRGFVPNDARAMVRLRLASRPYALVNIEEQHRIFVLWSVVCTTLKRHGDAIR